MTKSTEVGLRGDLQKSQNFWQNCHPLIPAKFIEKLDEHAARDALVFNEIGFFHVGLALFFKAHGYLADHYVNVGQPKRTREELIALMKERLRPMRSWGNKDEFPESKKATKAA